MTIAQVGTLGTGTSNVSGTSVAITTTAAAEAGNLVLLLVAKDNTTTSDGQVTEVVTVSDSGGGNGWQRLGEFCNGQGSAAAGATVSLWMCRLTNAIASSGTITVTTDTCTAKCAAAYELTVAADHIVVPAGTLQTLASDGADLASMVVSGLDATIGYLAIRASACEGSGITLSGTSAGFSDLGAVSVGSGAAGMSAVWEVSQVPGSTSFTSDPTASATADSASVMVVLQEISPPAVVLSGVL